MPDDVTTESTIRRPVEVVSAYAAEPLHAPEWYDNITSAEWKTEPPVRVGSRFSFSAQFMGRRLTYTYEVSEYLPGERMIMRTAEGPFPMETTYSWRRLDDHSTRMTLRNRGAPAGFSKLATPMIAAAMRRANRQDLNKLRAILENGA